MNTHSDGVELVPELSFAVTSPSIEYEARRTRTPSIARRLYPLLGAGMLLQVSSAVLTVPIVLPDERNRDTITRVEVFMRRTRRISRSEARRIAFQILEQAETRRITYAELEAQRELLLEAPNDI
jgi:hypothetical protein